MSFDPDTLRKAFSTVLRQRRTDLAMSQELLAEKADVSLRYISLLERGGRQPTISTLAALCSALNVSMSDFTADMEALAASQAEVTS